MANPNLFKTLMGRLAPAADTVNEAGGTAYTRDAREALAQLVLTGTLNGTFYASAETQFATIAAQAAAVSDEYLAKLAVFARQHGRMKDTPALLLALLAVRNVALFQIVAPRVVDNLKMLRNLVQIIRSGVTGRKSLGSAPKRFVQRWLEVRPAAELFRADVGANPSLSDLVRLVHPRPADADRSAFHAYLLGQAHDAARLPEVVRAFEAFKANPVGPTPDVPFQLLSALPLTTAQWAEVARRASWTTTRMNLNTFVRHGVFHSALNPRAKEDIRRVAERLADAALVRKAGVYPFQLLATVRAVGAGIPASIASALEAALEASVANVPVLPGAVVVAPDVSGSMRSPVTGVRRGATTKVSCLDAAALVTAAVLRRNPRARVIPFASEAFSVELDPAKGIIDNAGSLAALPHEGTNCAAPLMQLNRERAAVDLVILVSDNQSWLGFQNGAGGTAVARQWNVLKARNPTARLVLLDLQPYATTQARSRADVLNVGGFSDAVFDLVDLFARGELEGDAWVRAIESVPLAEAEPAGVS